MVGTGSSSYDSSYAIGQATGRLVLILGLAFLVVWLVRRARTTPPAAVPVRTPETDLAVLATLLTIQAAADVATALVTRVLGQHPILTPVPSSVPTWRLGGGHPYLTLTPTPAGSVLRVQEVEVPLTSPQPAVVWDWALSQVQQAAGQARIPTYRGQQGFTRSRAGGPASEIWSAVV